LAHTLLEASHLGEQARLLLRERFGARLGRRLGAEDGGRLAAHGWVLSGLVRSSCCRRVSTSFSRSIILSSRPTSSSSYFSSSTTSRNAAINSRVSSGGRKRDSDCSSTSLRCRPSSSDTASLACRILPDRSETNTGSGACLIKLSAYHRALSSSRMSRRMPIAP